MLSSLGLNVGRTGGSILAETMIAMRTVTGVRNIGGNQNVTGNHTSNVQNSSAGAALGAAAADGDIFVKTVAAAGTLLMLHVLFLLLLPGLIFGGFQDAQSPHDVAAPVLNSETAIVEIANELELTVNGVLQEGLDDVKSRIQADFEASGADCMEIVDPYAAGVQGNIRISVCSSPNTALQTTRIFLPSPLRI